MRSNRSIFMVSRTSYGVCTSPLIRTTANIYILSFASIRPIFLVISSDCCILLARSSAFTAALTKLSVVLLRPVVRDHASEIPPNRRTSLMCSPTTSPSPRGADMSSTLTEPIFPFVVNGNELGNPHLHSQLPQP